MSREPNERTHSGPRATTLVVIVVIVVAVAIGACTLLQDGPPENTCTVDSDCFRAQGEHCDQDSHTCVVVDAGVDAP